MVDLQFIESTNRWISETQVKIKSEVALSNQQAHTLKNLLTSYQLKIDAILNPNLDKQVTMPSGKRIRLNVALQGLVVERSSRTFPPDRSVNLRTRFVFELFEQRFEYSSVTVGQIETERLASRRSLEGEERRPKNFLLFSFLEELINDLSHTPGSNDFNGSRRASKFSASEDAKSVKFGVSSSMALTSLTQFKGSSNGLNSLAQVQSEEPDTLNTIRTLLQ